MGRAAWTGPVLNKATRARVDAQLKDVLPGTADQRRRFLEAAEECIDYYRKLYVPADQEHRGLGARFTRLAAAAREFAAAMAALGPEADLITQAQFLTLGAGDPADLERRTAEAVDWAEVTARAADRLLDRPITPIESKTSPAQAKLIMDLAEAYDRIFGERPSPARLGSFMQAIGEILKACGAPILGESAVKTVLKRAQLSAPPPKRGRKRREDVAAK
jgi:hypothetical protein